MLRPNFQFRSNMFFYSGYLISKSEALKIYSLRFLMFCREFKVFFSLGAAVAVRYAAVYSDCIMQLLPNYLTRLARVCFRFYLHNFPDMTTQIWLPRSRQTMILRTTIMTTLIWQPELWLQNLDNKYVDYGQPKSD